MEPGPVPPNERFSRDRVRHRFTARDVTVAAVSQPEHNPTEAPFTRVTFTGPDLHDFIATGPSDHLKLFFPDPRTGVLTAPRPIGPGADGIIRPEAPALPRDMTPLNVRTDPETGWRTFDVDFLRHETPGPASQWAARASVGDRLVAVGPRGSISAPRGPASLLLAVDACALPAASRWIAAAPPLASITVLADLHSDELPWADRYLASSGRDIDLVAAPAALAEAVRETGVDDGTFVFGAGEARSLIPLRRLLKYELGLPRTQYSLSGYWKFGAADFDHHAPIDPDDPDDA